MAYNDGVKATPIAYIGVMSVLVTIIIVMALQILFFNERAEIRTADEATQGPPAELADLTAKQLTALTRREVVDHEKGIVTIGISRAMDLVVADLAAGKEPTAVIGPNLVSSNPGADGTLAPKTEDAKAQTEPDSTPPKAEVEAQQEKKDDAQS